MRFTSSEKSLFRRIFYAILSGLLIFVLALSAACGETPPDEDDDDDDDDTQTETPYKPIANNDFTELYDTSSGMTYNPRVPKDWSFSGDYADSSNKAPDSSGTYTRYGTISVIDRNFEHNRSKYETNKIKDYNAEIDKKEDLSDEQKAEQKVKLPNPFTKNYDENLDKDEENGYYTLDADGKLKVDGEVTRDDDKVLMIGHLRNTASRYRSSSITVQPNAVLKITVRVFTMYFNPETGKFDGAFPARQDGTSLGATLSLTGGVEEPFTITGIDTRKQWKEFEFYIRGDATATRTVYLELGLGSGDPDHRECYGDGYAFFDNVSTEYFALKDFPATADYSASLDGDASDEIFENRHSRTTADNDAWTTAPLTARYDFGFGANPLISGDNFIGINDDVKTTEQINGSFVNSASWSDNAIAGGTDFSTYVQTEYQNKPFEQDFYALYNKKHSDGTNDKLNVSQGMQFALGTLQENKYYRVSLWMKSSAFSGKSGANLYLLREGDVNGYFEAAAQLNNLDTTTNEMKKADLEKDENGYYKLNGWRLYSFYIKGGNATTDDLSLEVWFGGKTDKRVDQITYPDNYQKTLSVLFTSPVIEEISSSYYSSASSAENIATADLSKSASTVVTNGGFSSVLANASENEDEQQKIVKPSGWIFIGGLGDKGYNSAPYSSDALTTGVLNNKNADKFPSVALNADESVLLMNATNTAYGYRSSSITVPANSVYRVQISAKNLGAGKANVYLTDTDGNVITLDDGENAAQKLQAAVTATDWTEYTFVIRTGAKAKTFTLELWIGDRFAEEGADPSTTYTSGTVLFDDAYFGGSSKTVGDALTPDQKFANESIDKLFTETKKFAEGNADADPDFYLEINPSSTAFYDYMEIDLEEDEEEDVTPPEEEETPAPSSGFGWLDIATLVIALALIFALGTIAFKQIKSSKFIKRRQLKKAEAKAKHRSYDRKHATPVTRRKTENGEEADEDEADDEELDEESSEEEEPALEGSEFDEDLETDEIPETVEDVLEAERADDPDSAEEITLPREEGETDQKEE